MMNRTNMVFCAVAACVTVLMGGAAQAAPVVIIEQSAPGEGRQALLNDGQVVVEEDQYAACPPPQSHFNCFPAVTSRRLVVASASSAVKTPGTIAPYEFLNNRYLINNLGKIVTWPSANAQASDVLTLDTHGSQPQPFASDTFQDNAASGCKINDQAHNWVALSNGGQLVGQITKASCAGSFALWSGKALQTVAALPSGYGTATLAGVNAAGQLAVTGKRTTTSASSATRAFQWDGAKYNMLSLPLLSSLSGYSASNAAAINDAGDVAGDLVKPDGSRHAAVWRAGRATDIGTLSGYKSSTVIGLNSKGLVLACAYTDKDDFGMPSYSVTLTPQLFLWDKGIRKAWTTASAKFLNSNGVPRWLPFTNCAAFYQYGQVGLHLLTNQNAQWLFNGIPDESVYLVSQP